MKSPDRIPSPEESAKLFKMMHDVVEGKIKAEEVVDDSGELKPLTVEKPMDKVIRPKNFTNSMSAQAEWEKDKERREDEGHEKRKAA